MNAINDREQARAIGAEVAQALGEGWSINNNSESWGANLIGPNDEDIFIRLETYGAKKGRLTISGNYPGTHEQQRRVERHRIGVSADRSATAIAREIERRLLPDYRESLATVRMIIALDEHYDAIRQEVGQEFATLLGTSFRAPQNEVTYPLSREGYGSIKLSHSGATADVELRGLPIDVVRAVVKTLADAYPTTERENHV